MKGKKLLSIILAGCMLGGLAVPVAAKDVETLTLLTYVDWYGDGMKALEDHINANAEELGFKLEIEQIPGGEQGDELLAARTATNDLPDLLNTYSAYRFYSSCGGEGKMVSLEGLDSIAEYDQETLSTSTYSADGELMGLPFGSGYYYGTYYNKEVLEEAGIDTLPKNWEEFLDCCEKIKAIGKIPFYISAADAWTLTLIMEAGFHKDYLDRGMDSVEFWDALNANQIKYTECENAKAGMEKTKELIDKGYVQETYLSDTYDMAQTALTNGDCAFYLCANTVVSEIAAKYPDKVDKIGGFDYPLFGNGENTLSVAAPTILSVTTAAKNPELAKKALDYICSAEAVEIFANAQAGVYINNKVEGGMPAALLEQREYSQVDVMNPKYATTVLGPYTIDYFIGAKTIDEVMSSMDEECARSAEAVNDSNWK